MRRLIFSLICSSGNAANVLKPTNVGILPPKSGSFTPCIARFGLLRTLADSARLSLIKTATPRSNPMELQAEGGRRGMRCACVPFLQPGWSKTMAKEELKWQNIDADDLPAAVKKSFDAMVVAEAAFKADLEKLLTRTAIRHMTHQPSSRLRHERRAPVLRSTRSRPVNDRGVAVAMRPALRGEEPAAREPGRGVGGR